MAEVTLHFRVDRLHKTCSVCGADLNRRVSRWWLTNCWTDNPREYRADCPVRRRVCLTAWHWSADIAGYLAPGGWALQKRGGSWVASFDGANVLRDPFLSNVMMGLCG